jgi:uncharacterized protein (DUF58 family)
VRTLGDPHRTRHRPNLTAGALVVLAALSLLLWLLGRYDVHLAIGVAVLVAVVADGALAHRAVSRAAVEVRGPSEVPAGTPSPWVVRVLGWRRPVSVHAHLLGGARPVLVADERPGQLVWPPLHRGLVPFLVVDASASGPLGLVSAGRRHVVRFAVPVAVTPLPVPVELDWPRPRAVGFGLHEGAPLGDDLFRSIRPYRGGDERRRVHWASTARHGEVMVREAEGTGVVRARVVVDLGPPGPAADHVAGVASSVVSAALDRGWQVELVTLDASRLLPHLAEVGEVFGRPPTLAPPHVAAVPTLAAPVHNAAEVRRRLAVAGYGPPAAASRPGRLVHECHIGVEGVAWR